MVDPKGPTDIPEIPSILKRDETNRALFMREDTEIDMSDDLLAPVEAPPAKPKVSKPKATKTAVKASGKVKAKVAETLKAKAKPASKAAKPAEKVKKSKAETAPKDQFGLRAGSAKSKAVAMYARKNGATLAEVKEKVGSIQLNVLNDLEEKGHKVERIKEERKGQRPVTRYILKV